MAAVALLAAGVIGWAVLTTGVAAAETGTLKLMVTDCSGTPYDGISVEVGISRTGSGIISTDSGYTDDGYVEFTFTILEEGDLAHVEVASCGETELAHVYVWVSEGFDKPGFWDIGPTIPRSGCADGWWNENENIIQCKCE